MALGKIPDSSRGQAATAGLPGGGSRPILVNRRRRGFGRGQFRSAPCHPSLFASAATGFWFIRWPKPRAHLRGTAEVEGLGRIFPQSPWGRYPIAAAARPPPPVCQRRLETHFGKPTAARIRPRPVSVSALPHLTLCIGRDGILVYSVAETSRPRQGDSRG